MGKNIFLLFLVLSFSCTNQKDSYPVHDTSFLLVPLGSAPSPTFSTEILINQQPYVYSSKDDGFGGSWAAIPVSVIDPSAELTVRYSIKKRETTPYVDLKGNHSWLKENRLIDWKTPCIMKAAEELDLMGLDRAVAIQSIGAFVKQQIRFDMSYSHDPALFTASETLEKQVGVCINYSRLFVALCRASGIPSRTVSGIVRDHENQAMYDFHHEWMEYLDKEGRWHPLDLTYSTNYELNDPRYAGFVYGAEDHPWFKCLKGSPIVLKDGNIVLFHYLPIFKGARFGFDLLESQNMKYYLIEKNVQLERNRNRLIITRTGEEIP